MRSLLPFLLIALLFGPGCFYKVGSGLMAGVLDEAGGKGRSEGLDPVVEGLVDKALLAELGEQLGQGLETGVTDITPEQRKNLEATIDGLITVALMRAGQGLRRDVSPELRALVQRDLIEVFAEGVRGELGDSLEETVDRVITRAVISARTNLQDEDTKFATSDLLRDSIYMAMREGYASPAVGDTVQYTLEENVLDPFKANIGDVAIRISDLVDEQTSRADNTLRAVIGFLTIGMGVLSIFYFISRRQLRREHAMKLRKEAEYRSMDAAMSQLDPETRAAIQAKLQELRAVMPGIEDNA